MGKIRCILCLALLATVPVTIHRAQANQEIRVERATEEETRQVREVSDTFERRMRETRDVASVKDLFLNDFARLQREQEKAASPDQSVTLIPSIPLSIEAELTSRVTREDWERFYAANLNLRYYFVLLIASRLKPREIENGKDELAPKIFPAEVLALLQADPFLSSQYSSKQNRRYQIETVDELRSLIATLEQATHILRQRFLKDPPEQTRIYQDNFRTGSKQKAVSTQPNVYGTHESRLGFPIGTRFFNRLTVDSLFELWFVKTDGGMKIVWARVYPFN